MPRGDGMGPMGMGPMTGWGAGYCAGYGMPGYMTRGGRRGAWGHRGRFWGNWAGGRPFPGGGYGPRMGTAWPPPYYAVGLSAEEEKEALSRQVDLMEDQLQSLKQRMADLDKE